MFITALVVLFIFKLRFPRNQPLPQVITRRYGLPTLRLFRKYEKAYQKVEKLKCDRKFLIVCKSHEVLPRFLHFKLYRKTLHNSKLYRSWQFKLLHLEITSKNRQILKFQKSLEECKTNLKSSVSVLDFICMNNFIENSIKKFTTKISETHEKKLKNLGISSQMYPLDPNLVIFNYSNRILTDQERNLLTLGLNFKLPMYKLNFFDYFLSFENLYSYLSKFEIYNPHNVPNILKNTLHNIAHKYFYKFSPHKVFCPFFSKHEINTLRNLSKDRSITICRPDKGTGVVILDKLDYENKMLTILNDQSKFKQLQNIDPLHLILRCEDKINRFLRQLKSSNTITPNTYTTLFTSGSTPGVIYGLPKTHKPNHPLRPILTDNKTFQQIDGVAMGSPLGPTLANIFMCHHEQQWLDNCPTKIKPQLYQRFVDDTFLLFNNQQNPKQFLDYLNKLHNNIKFTSESKKQQHHSIFRHKN